MLGGIIAGIVAGIVIGLVNGILIGVVRTNPVLTTLGTNVAALGVALIFTQGDYRLHRGPVLHRRSARAALFGVIPNTLVLLSPSRS